MALDHKNPLHRHFQNPARDHDELKTRYFGNSEKTSVIIDASSGTAETNVAPGDHHFYKDLGPAGKKLMIVRNGKITAAQG